MITNFSGIYCVLNIINGKKYIGQAANMCRRFGKHSKALVKGCHSNLHLQSAFNKYGESAFVFKTILICETKDLTYYEQKCMDVLGAEYNVAPAAGSTLGLRYKHTEEVRGHMSMAQRGVKRPGLSRALTGRNLSLIHCENIGKAHKGRKHSPAWCTNDGLGHTGLKYKHSVTYLQGCAFRIPRIPWNRGRTKESDERVRRNGESISRAKTKVSLFQAIQ